MFEGVCLKGGPSNRHLDSVRGYVSGLCGSHCFFVTLNVLDHIRILHVLYNMRESRFLHKCNVCTQAYATLFKDA